jgi:hypothetical protein
MKSIGTLIVAGICAIFATFTPVAAQSAPADPIQIQQQIDQLKLKSGQANDQAKQLDQSAANEDRLAQTGPSWARAIHAGAAIAFRAQATQLRQSAQQLVTQAQDLERQLRTAQQSRAGAESFKAPAAMHLPRSEQDYLNLTDPAVVEGAIVNYLNQNGVKAARLVGNTETAHFVQILFTGRNGQPNFLFRITALAPSGNMGEQLQLIAFTLETNVRAENVSEPLYAAMMQASTRGNCSWFVRGTVQCRSWLDIPGAGYAMPTKAVMDKVAMMNSEWGEYAPQIMAVAK